MSTIYFDFPVFYAVLKNDLCGCLRFENPSAHPFSKSSFPLMCIHTKTGEDRDLLPLYVCLQLFHCSAAGIRSIFCFLLPASKDNAAGVFPDSLDQYLISRRRNYFEYISEYFSVILVGSSKCWKSFRSDQSPPHSKPFSVKSL